MLAKSTKCVIRQQYRFISTLKELKSTTKQDGRLTPSTKGSWEDIYNQQYYFSVKVAESLRVLCLDDWYSVTWQHIILVPRAGTIVNRYSGSLSDTLRTLYPMKQWDNAKFRHLPRGHWDEVENQRHTLENVASKMRIKTFDDWYNVTKAAVVSKETIGILNKNKSCLSHTLKTIYPSYDWIPWKFSTTARKSWDDVEKRREWFECKAYEMNLKTLDDMSNQSWDSLSHAGGATIQIRQQSFSEVLTRLYPYFEFKRPRNFWNTKSNVIQFLQRAKGLLKVHLPQHWYRVSTSQLVSLGGQGILRHFPQALSEIHPFYKWDLSKFAPITKKAKQRLLIQCIKDVVPYDIAVEEEQFIGVHRETGSSLTVDIFIPRYNLAIEYQGEHHYHDHLKYVVPTTVIEARDSLKQDICRDLGISLVLIPYWWSGEHKILSRKLKPYCPVIESDEANCDTVLDVSAFIPDNLNSALMSPEASTRAASQS